MYKKINKEFNYKFNVEKNSIYTVSIEASCKSGKLFGLFGGQDLRAEIDGIKLREIPDKKRSQYYNIPPTWNGTELKGLSKTVIFILQLSKGEHTINFIPKRGAEIHKEPEVAIFDSKKPVIKNIQAQEGNRRPWITVALVDLSLKTVDVAVSCEKRAQDSDDVKLIIDNKIQKNENKGWWAKNWHWRGSDLQGKTKDARFYPNLPKGIHYIELWADRTPTIESLSVNIGVPAKALDNKKEEDVVLRLYTCRGVSGKEDYNRYDNEIRAAVDYWNNQFLNDADPPKEPLDPNLVKAMIFVESRMGYYPGGEVDVMQVGNPGDKTLKVLNGKSKKPEYWIHDNEEILLDYDGDANANSPKESIWWGVRWLHHKAQGITNSGKRYWVSWKEAMEGYGSQEKDHNDAIWSIYEKGVDTRENKSIRLWSFTFIALLFILLLNYGMFESQDVQDKGHVSGVAHKKTNRIETNKYIDQHITHALSEYKNRPEDYWGLFLPLGELCEDGNCERPLAVDYILGQYIDDLVAQITTSKKLLEIMDIMDILEPNTWEHQDIDNDGEKEIVIVDLDMLNHRFLDVKVIDVAGDGMVSYTKRFEDYQYFGSPDSMLIPDRPLRLLDITGDTVPEILVFGSWGRMGTRLRILQYKNGVIEDKEFVNDFTYPVYTFYDIDNDGVLEISASGDDPCNYGTFAYSCDSMYKDAIIKYDKKTDSFVYNRT